MAEPKKFKNSQLGFKVEVSGRKELSRALKVLQEKDLPFLKPALAESGEIVSGEGSQRAGKIGAAVKFAGVRGNTVGGVKAVVKVEHPAGKSFEFGRQYYYRGYKGRNQKSGSRVKVAGGMKPRPFLGIKHEQGSGAIAASRDRVVDLLSKAIDQEWNRIGGPE